MQSKVRWTINNELDGAKFERHCVDLLYRDGYKEIVPIESQGEAFIKQLADALGERLAAGASVMSKACGTIDEKLQKRSCPEN
ncbi:hypothetical protein ACPOL_0299 [Acidisarcina polymorpha]|uniref:Uncharacterized protein n=1 Tax=Acidisarcina polymorpha TaxID=2211140 RepID=A0A2Z5FSA5_9BACT|nr:hypothetical protein [Acidisarcina polymorpha]AXC09682.1 hypothetical protein ACPOL_0299 [Acidisarcina polymorpha]